MRWYLISRLRRGRKHVSSGTIVQRWKLVMPKSRPPRYGSVMVFRETAWFTISSIAKATAIIYQSLSEL